MFPQGYVPGADANAVNLIGNVAGPLYKPVAPLPTQPAPTNTGGAGVGGGGGGGTGGGLSAQDLAYLNDQGDQLRRLLARTDTGLNQGLTRNEDEYNTQVGATNQEKERAVINENKSKLGAYDTINRNASTGYRSLAQLIGRAAGTGSSAFQEALPDVVGKDTSSKRRAATNTSADNLSNIDTSFEAVLADLLKQKKANEESLRSGVEGQRQDINAKLAKNAAQIAQAKGGGYEAVKAAMAPFNQEIESSRDRVESFFSQFRTPFTPKAADTKLNEYNTDRSTINAGNSGTAGMDPNNPYGALLRKKLQGGV